ncbi:hypothetical protein [Kangiella aquimarina]|uniref:VanZ-like domain-containing protein n=1 Tax=Kangiella aquimarina TaxID=261965 RepID=A0ABZ0X209_9GAMM|nr:hypothetical protein [Kangiella aquimarina]WQG84621.1 hypothetical protein SR900_09120 [Kangiella aquimarina]
MIKKSNLRLMVARYILWLLFIGFQLLIGVIIYLQSGNELVAFAMLSKQLPAVMTLLTDVAQRLPLIYQQGWVAYHLPDILWSSACASFLVGLWVNQFSLSKLLPLGMGCAIFYELLQFFGVTNGTYDHFDLFYSLLAGAGSTLLTYLLLRGSLQFKEDSK